jgi:quinol monooxygenase YgiN
MLTIIAEIRTKSGGQHRQNVLDAFQKIIPTVLAEDAYEASLNALQDEQHFAIFLA